MDNVAKVLDFLRIPNPFRDLITLMGGYSSLVFFQISLKINFLTLFNLGHLGRIELDFTVLVIAYLWGRLLHFLSVLIIDSINLLIRVFQYVFLNLQSVKTRWVLFKQYWSTSNRWKIDFSEFLYPKNFWKPIFPDEVKREINIVEVSKVLSDNPNLVGETERYVYNQIFLRIILSTSLIACVFISKNYILPFLFSLYLYISLIRDMNYRERGILRSIVKEQIKKKE